MRAYYNEFDPGAAAWLRELIKAGHIAPGDVDERSIVDVRGSDLRGYGQCHFFAGIGGWSYALRLAGWADDRPVWTGSCPCQPFSAAGKRKGTADARHLWPEFRRLIAECGPAVVFGEQVASKDGRDWLAGVRLDLEELAYAVGAADLCAAGAGEEGEGWILRGDQVQAERIVVGAPHIRQRLWWVADASSFRQQQYQSFGRIASQGKEDWRLQQSAGSCETGRLADADKEPCRQGYSLGRGGDSGSNAESRAGPGGGCEPGGVADANGGQPWHGHIQPGREHGQQPANGGIAGGMGNANEPGSQRRAGQSERADECASRSAGLANFWSDFDAIPCADGRTRRIESGSFPLAHGVPARVGRLRGYGNAIVPQVAAEFVKAFIELK